MNRPSAAPRGRILIADDEHVVLSTLSGLLEVRGFACTCVRSGTEVVAQLRAGEFDVLISDLHMPGNEGLSLIEEVPALVAGLPVVVLTGNPTVETAARAIRLPVVAYLTKPPNFDELATILDEAVLGFRAYRAMQASRRQLHNWSHDLDRLLQQVRAQPRTSAGSMGSYLRVTLQHVIGVLTELEQATHTLESSVSTAQALQEIDREAALRRTVDVLRRTKQNFKSKELAELRKELERLISPDAEPAEASPN